VILRFLANRPAGRQQQTSGQTSGEIEWTLDDGAVLLANQLASKQALL